MKLLQKYVERWQQRRLYAVSRSSASVIKNWQERHLKRLIRRAALMPFWHQRFLESGVEASRFHGFDDLRRIPPLSKDDFRASDISEYTESGTAPELKHTSGTSGKPFSFVPGKRARHPIFWRLASLKFLFVESWSVPKSIAVKIAQIKVGVRTEYLHKDFLMIAVGDFRKEPLSIREKLNAFEPDILIAYPSVLRDLAHSIQKDAGENMIRPRYLVSSGEKITPQVRTYIEDVFGVTIYDRYGIQEVGVIGVECRVHDGFHINEESLIVEVVHKGMPVPDGETGEVLITDLFNTTMPFIRYSTGDLGTLRREPCSCGLSSARLWIDGRIDATVPLAGRIFHHLELTTLLNEFMESIVEYQIVKTSPDQITLRIVPARGFNDMESERIKKKFRTEVNVAVKITCVENIVRPTRAKNQLIVDETQQ